MNIRLKLLLKILAVVAGAEFLCMALISQLWKLPSGWLSTSLDTASLTLLIAPFFYFWLFREIGEKTAWRRAHQNINARYQTLVDNIAAGVTLIGPDFRIRMVNSAAARLFDKDPAYFTGRECFREFEKRGEVCAHCPGRKAMETGRSCEVETEGVRDDGGRFRVRIHAYPVLAPDGQASGFIELVEDISAQRLVQASLRESEERYRSVVDNVGIGIALIDPQMRILSLNRQMRTWFPGIDPGQKPVCYRAYNTPPREEACSYCPTQKTFQDGQVHEAVTDTPTPDGIRHYRVVSSPIKDADGRVTAAIEMAEDITASLRQTREIEETARGQKAIDELLRLSLSPGALPQKLEKMLAHLLAVPWFTVEGRGCVFVLEGPALVMTAQLGLSEPVRRACGRLPLGRCLCGRAARDAEEVLAADLDERHEVTYAGMHRHGHICLPLKGEGQVLGVLNLYLKAGEKPDRRALDLARAAADILDGAILLAKSEERFLQSQKMEAVGQLAGGVAHDFNNILTAIKGYSEFLLGDFTAGDPRREDVAEIRRAADRAASLTRQLLAFSRRQVLAPRSVDLKEVVSAMAPMLRRLLGEDVRFEARLDPRPVLAFVDQGQMEQVLMNLVVNARDAMPQGGAVTVSAANVPRPGGPGPAGVLLAVADTGLGMSPEVLAHLFEPFFTTKEKGKGTGLGLATVYGIVKQSGGEIEVDSAPGRGSVFRIQLPASQEAAAAQGAAAAAGPPPAGTETVLLVEDEEAVRALSARTLARAGYRVLSAGDARSALELVQDGSVKADLLLTDVVLPGLSGPDLAARLLQARPRLKVLFISGYEDGILAKHGMLAPDVVLFLKPFTPDSLLRKVREVLDAPAS
ncbi:MAG: PAS domain-containing protein [Elusimicrobia bacterium]|nr:PAS domain-containing protein [Elusimicrobiota bacterium]